MLTSSTRTERSFGGLLFPLDPFRITVLAAVVADAFVSKARNIIGAKLRLTRHETSQLVLARIVGDVVGTDEAAFWRENADVALAVSHALPRQVFLVYVDPKQPRREGFLAAARGQVLGASEATPDTVPAGTPASDWPVARLIKQLGLRDDDLMAGFPRGPSVEVSLLEPQGDDEALLMTLAGQGEDDFPDDAGDPGAPDRSRDPGAPAAPRPHATAEAGAPSSAPGAAPRRESIEADLKRREQQRHDEATELRARQSSVGTDLRHAVDDLGIVVAPKVEIHETELLRPFIVRAIEGDVPPGVPRALIDGLLGKRCDLAVPVEFLSEVFFDAKPLDKAGFEANAETRTLGGQSVRAIAVLAPRLGPGTLFRLGTANVFTSRRAEEPVPESFILALLHGS